MLVEDYDMDEKQDVAIITPADSPPEPEPDLEPLADECEEYHAIMTSGALTFQTKRSNLASYHPFLTSRSKMKDIIRGISLITGDLPKEKQVQYSMSEVIHGEEEAHVLSHTRS